MTPQELNELLQNVGIMTAEKKPELNGMENTEGVVNFLNSNWMI